MESQKSGTVFFKLAKSCLFYVTVFLLFRIVIFDEPFSFKGLLKYVFSGLILTVLFSWADIKKLYQRRSTE